MKSRCFKQYLYTEDQIAFLFSYFIVPADNFLSGFMFSNYKGNDRLNLVNQLIVLITKTTVSLMNNLSAFFLLQIRRETAFKTEKLNLLKYKGLQLE